MKNSLLSSRGMSLVEVMIGVSIAAGIGLMMMRNQDNANKMQAKVVANQDINAAVNIIQTQLANRAVCSMSLAGKKPVVKLPGQSVPATSVVPALVDAVVNPLYNGTTILNEYILKSTKKHVEANTLLPGNKVKMLSMELIIGADGKDYLEARFEVDPNSTGANRKAYGGKEIMKRFPIMANKNALGEILNCYSEQTNLLSSAIQQSCTSMGATWDTSVTPPRCKLTNLPQCIMTESSCSGVFNQNAGTWKWDVKIYGRKKCRQEYRREFITCGQKTFTRDCYCGGSTGVGCNCDTGQVGCYHRTTMSCWDEPENSEVSVNRCCRAP